MHLFVLAVARVGAVKWGISGLARSNALLHTRVELLTDVGPLRSLKLTLVLFDRIVEASHCLVCWFLDEVCHQLGGAEVEGHADLVASFLLRAFIISELLKLLTSFLTVAL